MSRWAHRSWILSSCVFVALCGGCAPAEESKCLVENHCITTADGDFMCEEGHVWENPNDADNYNCVADDCLVYGRYNDGVCDSDCAKPDPDCSSGGNTSDNSSDNSNADDSDDETEESNGDDDVTSVTEDSSDQTTDSDESGTEDETANDDEESNADNSEDTPANDETADDETAVTDDDITEAGEPVIISLSTNTSLLNPGETLIVSAIVTDPDGIDDLIGGTLSDPTSGGTYGSFATTASEGSYSLSLTMTAINTVREVTTTTSGTSRTFKATFFDQAGHSVSQSVSVSLDCANDEQAICNGVCKAIQTDKNNCGSCFNNLNDQGYVASNVVCSEGQPGCYYDYQELCGTECKTTSTESSCGTCEETIDCSNTYGYFVDEMNEDSYDYWSAYPWGCVDHQCTVAMSTSVSHNSAENLLAYYDVYAFGSIGTCDDVCAVLGGYCAEGSDQVSVTGWEWDGMVDPDGSSASVNTYGDVVVGARFEEAPYTSTGYMELTCDDTLPLDPLSGMKGLYVGCACTGLDGYYPELLPAGTGA